MRQLKRYRKQRQIQSLRRTDQRLWLQMFPKAPKQMEALNYYTNETVTIPLDPTSTPQENAQRFLPNTTNKNVL